MPESDNCNGKPQKIYINNLDDLIREVISFESDPTEKDSKGNPLKNLLWYRGLKSSNYNLVPRLFRTIDLEKGDLLSQLPKIEQELLQDFRVRNYHMISRLPENDLTWLSMMQHYEISTRLLDWSEQLLVSLFFALDDYILALENKVDYVPSLWCLKPIELNKQTIKYLDLFLDRNKLPDMFSIFPSDSKHKPGIREKYNLALFSTKEKYVEIKSTKDEFYPLAIISPYNNERIRAQSGTFTLFPSNINKLVASMDDCAMELLPNASTFLRQFVILKPVEMRQELKTIGFKKSLIFPELPVIAKELEQNQFNI